MTENELIANLFTVINAGLASRGISVGMEQSYQPTQQGTPSTPCIYLHKISDSEYGFPGKNNTYDKTNLVMVHTETQILETTFQVNATAAQDPSNITQLTSGDYVKAVARILGSDAAVVALQTLGIGIYRIQKITNTYFRDEREQNEASPSFDFTVTYATTETTIIQSTTVIAGSIHAV